ncbi:MAG TPA: MipA/OmpV family protein [Hyphomicrobiaceae bacterium]|nr:MipA/OmpV family protein [Hyphomicrobiaceae bacterium]
MSLSWTQGARHASVALVAWLVAGPAPAAAQDAADATPLFGNQWQIGGFIFVSPKFEGAKSYDVTGFPFVAPAALGEDGIVQIKGADDMRFRLLHLDGLEFGPLAGYRFGRDEDDSPRLRGLEDIDGGLVVGAFATYRTGPFAVSASYHHQATGDDTGGLVRIGAEYVSLPSPGLKVTAGVGTDYASEEYMTAFFGVTHAQSIASGLPAFDPSAGFKDVFAGITATVDLDERWSILLTGRYTQLIGDAADSPIVESESQLFGGLGVSYKFSLGP